MEEHVVYGCIGRQMLFVVDDSSDILDHHSQLVACQLNQFFVSVRGMEKMTK
jgi:hypothetical protein